MSLRTLFTGSLSAVLLCAFLLAGCLSSEDDPETSTDPATDGDEQETGDEMGMGGENPADGDGDPANETGQDDDPQDGTGEEEEECTFAQETLTSWSHDGPAVPTLEEPDPTGDPLLLLAQLSNETFQVPEGAGALIVIAGAGDHATLGWEISLLDPTGSAAYSFTGEPGPGIEGVTGEAIQETGNVATPLPGSWTLQASVTGYVEGLTIQVDANVCR